MSLYAELKRRNVVRVGLAYAVIGWFLAQIAEFAFENFGAPDWVLKSFTVLLLLGLPLALFFAWAFEVTPDGIKRERDVDRSQSITLQTGRKIDFVIITFLIIGLAYFFWESRLAEESTTGIEASIAVLPFVNMSNDPDQEYFADGMTEEILNTLAAIDGLRVAGRTSSFMFKDRTDVDFQTIGKMLGVANVLEGSVRKSGTKLRITAQLITADTGYHLWSKTFDRETADIFDIQDEIAAAIGEAMQLELGIGVAQAIDKRRLDNEEAHDVFLRGRAQANAGDFAEAFESYGKVIEMEPGYLPSYRYRTYAASDLLAVGTMDEKAYLDEAQNLLHAVTRLDPDSNERHYIAADIFFTNSDWQNAAGALSKITDTDNDPDHIFTEAEVAWLLGDSERALGLYKEYLILEPLRHDVRSEYALNLARTGHLADADIEVARLVQMDPDSYEVIDAKGEFHSYFNNELAEGLKWQIAASRRPDELQNRGRYIVGLLLDLGDESATRAWHESDPEFDKYAVLKRPVAYLVARYVDDAAATHALARQIGESFLGMQFSFNYLEDFDWLRLLQREDPDLALDMYQKRVPQLTTNAPKVFALDVPLAISLADLYLQTGRSALADDLLDQCLAWLTSLPDHYAGPSTTMIYALKGDTASALQSLREIIDANWRWEWWLLEKDRAYESLWDEPEFKAMMDEIRADMARQRGELHDMIDRGEIDLTPTTNTD